MIPLSMILLYLVGVLIENYWMIIPINFKFDDQIVQTNLSKITIF